MGRAPVAQGIRPANGAFRAPRVSSARAALWAALRSNWLLAGLLAVVTWPVGDLAPQAGLDPSWAAGLYMAAHNGLDYGRDIAFTFGPLGFLQIPSPLLPQAHGTRSGLHRRRPVCGCCLAGLYAARRSFSLLPALLLTFVAASVLSGERVVALAFLLSILALDPRAPAGSAGAPCRSAGASWSALELLRQTQRRGDRGGLDPGRRRGQRAAGPGARSRSSECSLVVSLLILWLVAAQSLTAPARLPARCGCRGGRLLRRHGGRRSRALLGVLGGRRGRRRSSRSPPGARRRPGRPGGAWPPMILTGVFIFGLFKAGFVRHDAGHSADLLHRVARGLAGLALASGYPGLRRAGLRCCSSSPISGVSGGEPSSVIDPARASQATWATQREDDGSTRRAAARGRRPGSRPHRRRPSALEPALVRR